MDAKRFSKAVLIEIDNSGVPGYQSLIDWSKYEGMDNAKAISLLSQRTELEFPAGSQYKYSNSGAVLIASAMERLTGKSYA